MGCSASKTLTIVAKNSEEDEDQSPYSYSSNSNSQHVPKSLSLPMPLVHHPPTKKGDTHHLVSLTSTTYGSLLLIDQKDPNFNGFDGNNKPQSPPLDNSLSPDSVINTWELMDGLNDDDDDDKSNFDTTSKKASSCNHTESAYKLFDSLSKRENFSYSPSSSILDKKPLWKHLSEEALLAKLDPNVALSYRKALSSRQLGRSSKNNNNNNNLSRGESSIGSNSPLSCCSSSFSNNLSCLSASEDNRIVMYFTSLRGIRKTYEDCCSVRMILRGFRVVVDEKDISMDSSYRKELENALGGKVVTLPHVFVRGKYVGNAEEIKLLNESGELANLLKGFPTRDPWFVCEICGDARFVPCANCCGSRKVFEEEKGELRRCQHCNENGLIRCSGCSL